jgi:hypothetical protein
VSQLFFRLGILNVRRQLGRSTLVVLTMALAAMSLTYSLSYQHITPPRVAEFLYNFAGGEVLVAPVRWAGQQVSDVTEETNYRYARLSANGTSWLEWFYPELYSEGFWAREGAVVSEMISRGDMEQLAKFPGIAEVNVTPLLPAVLQTRDDHGTVYHPLVIAPENPRLQQVVYVKYPRDFKQFPAGGGIVLNAAMQLPRTVHTYKPGEAVQLWLPQISAADEDNRVVQVDYAAASEVQLPFVNYVQVPTRSVSWHQEPAGTIIEEGKFRASMAWVDQQAWDQLLQQTGVDGQLPAANVALRLADPQQLSELLVQLGQVFPHLTFVNMGQVEDRIFSTGNLELFLQAPERVYKTTERVGLTVPASFNRILGLLFLLIAGFLLGGHMLTNAAARHQEIGTLRALGARRRDIMALGISEAATTTFIGVTSGFLLLRLYGAMMELRGGVPLLRVLWLMLSEYGVVLALALVASLVFACFPIWRLASLAPMEVLRNE